MEPGGSEAGEPFIRMPHGFCMCGLYHPQPCRFSLCGVRLSVFRVVALDGVGNCEARTAGSPEARPSCTHVDVSARLISTACR